MLISCQFRLGPRFEAFQVCKQPPPKFGHSVGRHTAAHQGGRVDNPGADQRCNYRSRRATTRLDRGACDARTASIVRLPVNFHRFGRVFSVPNARKRPQVWRVQVPERLDKKLTRLNLSIIKNRLGDDPGQQPPLSFQTAADRDLDPLDEEHLDFLVLRQPLARRSAPVSSSDVLDNLSHTCHVSGTSVVEDDRQRRPA